MSSSDSGAGKAADGAYFSPGSTNKQGVFRKRQWIYLGPVIAAPLTHMCVTLYRTVSLHCPCVLSHPQSQQTHGCTSTHAQSHTLFLSLSSTHSHAHFLQTPKKWRPWVAWGGVGGLSFLAVANRLVLMYHAGYPCEDHIDVDKRLVHASEEQPQTVGEVAKDVIKHVI